MIIRSFTWTSIRGYVEQTTCMADGAGHATLNLNFRLENNQTGFMGYDG